MIRAYSHHPSWVLDLLETSSEVIDHQEDIFRRFAASLPPTPVFQHDGREMANKIFEVIRRHSDPRISVDRVIIGGSMGRRTALHESFGPDFDLVIFLNNTENTEITTEFAISSFLYAIQIARLPGFNISRVKYSRICLTVHVDVNGRDVKYDILPALNMVPPGYQGRPQNYQAREVFAQLDREPNNRIRRKLVYTLNSRLAEVTRAHIRGRPSWMYDVVRLAKCWDRTLRTNIVFPYFSGRSYLIEIIALNACKGNKPSSRSAFLGFRRFLCWMCRLEEMTAILDPANRYNNLVFNLTDDIKELYKIYAARSLEHLRYQGYHLRRLNYDRFTRVLGF